MLRIPVEAGAVAAASAWLEIDLDAVAHNVRALKARLRPGCHLVAVVKANAYGHGMVRVARAALAAGADELAVASVGEGAQLRIAGITHPILIAGPVPPEDAATIVQHGLTASLGGAELASALARAARRYLPVQIEVDTGMARHGVRLADLPTLADLIAQRGKLSVAGVFTHFAGLSAADVPAMREQLRTFDAGVDAVRSLRGTRRHACNTLGALLVPEAHLDAVRIGGGLYGFDPLPGASGVQLQPALTLKARIVGLRDVAAGTTVGYGSTFVCRRPTRLALLAVGYADGLCRSIWRDAEVLVRGRRARIAGCISMNQIVVDVTDGPRPVFGEEVVLLGGQGDERIRVEERVPPGGSAYEVTSLLSAALPRVHVGGRNSPPRAAGAVFR